MRLDKPVYGCDWCKQPIPDPQTVKHTYGAELNAALIILGYSPGGWGTRKDFLNNSWSEVCRLCFSQYEILAQELKALTKGSRVK